MDLINQIIECREYDENDELDVGEYSVLWIGNMNITSYNLDDVPGVKVIRLDSGKAIELYYSPALIRVKIPIKYKELCIHNIRPFVHTESELKSYHKYILNLVSNQIYFYEPRIFRTGDIKLTDLFNEEKEIGSPNFKLHKILNKYNYDSTDLPVKYNRNIEQLIFLLRSILDMDAIIPADKRYIELPQYPEILIEKDFLKIRNELVLSIIMGMVQTRIKLYRDGTILYDNAKFMNDSHYISLNPIVLKDKIISEWFLNNDPLTYVHDLPCWKDKDLHYKIRYLGTNISLIRKLRHELKLNYMGDYIIHNLIKGLGLCR